MPHLYNKLLFHNWFINIHWVFDWNFHRNFNYLLNLNWTVNVNRLINVDRFFNDSWSWNLYGLNDFFLHFFYNLHGNFFFNLHILWHFHYLLDYSFRSRNELRYFHNHLNRFLYNDFFNDFFWNSTIEFEIFIISIFQQSSEML